MKFLRLFFRYLPRYKEKLALYVLFTFLGALFSVFSFTAIIPILNVLFDIPDAGIELASLADASSLKEVFKALGNNMMFYLQQQIQSKGASHVLLMSCLFWVGMTILKNCLTYTSSLFRAPIRHGIYRDMREELFTKIIHLPVDFFASAYKGDVMSRITSDIIEVAAGIKKAFNLLIKDAINILIPLITLLTISWKLTVVTLLMLPAYLWAFNKVALIVQHHTLRAQNLMGTNVSHFDQMMNGLRLIKSSAIENSVRADFIRQNEETRHQYVIRNWIADLSYPLSEIFMTSVAAVILWIGGNTVISGASTLGGAVFIYFLVVFISMVSPVMSATDAFFGIRQSIACIERLEFVLNVDTSKEESIPSSTDAMHIDSISVEDVSFGYNQDTPVLTEANLHIEGPGRYAIVGQSGIGKTTLIDLLFRFHDVTSGEIRINGDDIRGINLADLRKSISYVNQDTFLFNDTILYNITLGDTMLNLCDVESICQAIGIHDFIQSLPKGYLTVVGDQGVCLSCGQKQCIAIARALVRRNSVLILDEATSGLDGHTEEKVLKGIESIRGKSTILIISHRLSAIKDVDKIFVLKAGRTVAEGDHRTLKEGCQEYRELFNLD